MFALPEETLNAPMSAGALPATTAATALRVGRTQRTHVFIQLYEVNETRRCNFFLNYNFFFGDSVSKSSFLLSPATVPLVLKDEGPVTSSVPLWLL